MTVHRPIARRAYVLVVAIVILGDPTRANAADTTHACVEAAHDGQKLRDAGKLGDARASLLRGAAAGCPEVVRESCARWVAEIDARMPTIVLAARDDANADLTGVRASIDGVVVAETLAGRSFSIDPGRHEVVFDAPGRKSVRQIVVIREGEKTRPITAVLSPITASDAPTSAPFEAAPNLVPIVVAGSVAILGLAGFALIGALGQDEKNHLAETCAPTQTCDPSDVSQARTKLLVADALLVVGASAAIVTGVLVALLPKRATVSVAPTTGGVAFGYAQRF